MEEYGSVQITTNSDPDPGGPKTWEPSGSGTGTLYDITLLVWAQEPVPAAGEPAEAFLHAAGGEGGGEGHPADQWAVPTCLHPLLGRRHAQTVNWMPRAKIRSSDDAMRKQWTGCCARKSPPRTMPCANSELNAARKSPPWTMPCANSELNAARENHKKTINHSDLIKWLSCGEPLVINPQWRKKSKNRPVVHCLCWLQWGLIGIFLRWLLLDPR